MVTQPGFALAAGMALPACSDVSGPKLGSPGPPANLTIVSGDGQSAPTHRMQLQQPLVVKVTDAAGRAVIHGTASGATRTST